MAENIVVTSQPTGSGLLLTPVEGQRDWSSGLFACFSDGYSLCLGSGCYAVLLCSLATKLNECSLLPLCVPGGLIAMRARLRTLGGIQGSICEDWLVMTFCEQCAVCQMSREMDYMGL